MPVSSFYPMAAFWYALGNLNSHLRDGNKAYLGTLCCWVPLSKSRSSTHSQVRFQLLFSHPPQHEALLHGRRLDTLGVPMSWPAQYRPWPTKRH